MKEYHTRFHITKMEYIGLSLLMQLSFESSTRNVRRCNTFGYHSECSEGDNYDVHTLDLSKNNECPIDFGLLPRNVVGRLVLYMEGISYKIPYFGYRIL